MFVILIFVCFFILNSVKADCIGATTNFTCGDTVTESCTLNQSESCNGNGFNITTASVILNCSNYNITGNGTEKNYYGIITKDVDNVTVKNCQIKNFTWGIHFDTSNSSTAFNNTVNITNKTGISSEDSYNVNISKNYVEKARAGTAYDPTLNNFCNVSKTSGDESGILLIRGNGTIENNTFIGNEFGSGAFYHDGTETGITVCYSNNSLVQSNNIYYSDTYGFLFVNSSNNNIFYNYNDGNILTNDGIKVSNSHYNNLSFNIFYNNGEWGIFTVTNSRNNYIFNNTCSFNKAVGIRIGSDNNDIIKNVANNNTFNYGIYIYPGSDNNIMNNIANNNGKFGIYLRFGTDNNVTNNTFKNNGEYDFYIDSCGYADNVENNIGSGNRPIVYYDTAVTLQNDSNISELILCNADNSNIDNITVKGMENPQNNGIILLNTDNSNFTNINSSLNENGIYLTSSSNNKIANSLFNYNNLDGVGDVNYGIYLYSSSNNNLTNNTANYNKQYGIYLYESSNNNNITNSAINNNNNTGIYLGEASDNNRIENNNLYNDCYYGIYISHGYYNNIINNSINNSIWYGLKLNQNVTVINTTITNTAYGISLNSYNNLINNILQNNNYSIYLPTNSKNNLFQDSIITNSIITDYYSVNPNSENIFLNVSFNKSKTQITGGLLYVKRYADVYVNDSKGNAVPNADVTIYANRAGCEGTATSCSSFSNETACGNQTGCSWNIKECIGTATSCSSFSNETACGNQTGCYWSLNPLMFNITTNNSGYIQRQNLTEYFENSTTKYYYTNYSINATVNPISQTELVNLTTNKITDDNTEIVLTITQEPTTLTAIYESSIYTNTYFNIRANYSTTTGTPISGATCNLSITPGLDGGVSSFYVMGYNSGTGLYETLGLATSIADTYTIVIKCGKQYYQFQSGAGSFTVNEQSGGGGGGGSSPGQEPVCGNKICEEGETCINCPEDCICICGNGICEPGETYKTCNEDCCAPEGIQVSPPYNCCPGLIAVSDCLFGPCPISIRYCIRCGDGLCKEHENIKNCPQDCGVCNFNIPIKIRFVKGTGGWGLFQNN